MSLKPVPPENSSRTLIGAEERWIRGPNPDEAHYRVASSFAVGLKALSSVLRTSAPMEPKREELREKIRDLESVKRLRVRSDDGVRRLLESR